MKFNNLLFFISKPPIKKNDNKNLQTNRQQKKKLKKNKNSIKPNKRKKTYIKSFFFKLISVKEDTNQPKKSKFIQNCQKKS